MKEFSKEFFGKQLKILISSDSGIQDITEWAFNACNYNRDLEYMPTEVKNILEDLAMMSAGPEFEFTKFQLNELADKLIKEGELEELSKPIFIIKEKAIEVGQDWLMCPICLDAWKSNSSYAMVRCPGCMKKLHNPKYRVSQK